MSTTKRYHNISLTEKTISMRDKIKVYQDEFMTFSWDGYDAFDSFGAFIINENKGSLKFYNGPSFSNEYTKPQFDNAGGKIVGVNFNKQTISFTIGVYWISIDHYRLLINWLHPLKTSYLIFGYNRKYRYNVKLSKIGDSTRWVLGYETINKEKVPMYYTELSLTFEIQGEPCAKGVNSYEFGSVLIPDWKSDTYYWDYNEWTIDKYDNDSNVQYREFPVYTGQVFTFNSTSPKPRYIVTNSGGATGSWDEDSTVAKSRLTIPTNTTSSILRIQKINNASFNWSCMNSGDVKIDLTGVQNTGSKVLKNVDGKPTWVLENTNRKYFFFLVNITNSDYLYVNKSNDDPNYIRFIVCKATKNQPIEDTLAEIAAGNDDAVDITHAKNSKAFWDSSPSVNHTVLLDKGYCLLLQVPSKYVTANGKLKEDFAIISCGSTMGIKNWLFNAQGHIKHYNHSNVLVSAPAGTTKSYYYDYPVYSGESYLIKGTTKDNFPCYLLLDSNKNLIEQDVLLKSENTILSPIEDENGKQDTRQIKIFQDGFLRIQFSNWAGIEELKRADCEYSWTMKEQTSNVKVLKTDLINKFDFIPSDIATPFELTIPLNICQDDNVEQAEYNVQLIIKREGESSIEEQIPLFQVQLCNLTHSGVYDYKTLTRTMAESLGVNIPNEMSNWEDNETLQSFINKQTHTLKEVSNIIKPQILFNTMYLTYNSQNGLLYLKYNDSSEQILTLLSLSDNGQRIVKSCQSYKTKLPGDFDYPGFYDKTITLELRITKINVGGDGLTPSIPAQFYEKLLEQTSIIAFPRTNLI